MVMAVTGRLDFGEVVKLADKYCGSWAPVNAPRQQSQPVYKPQRHAMTDPKLNRMYTMAMTPGPSAQDERRFAARVLSDVIGDSDGSRFYWALVDNAVAEEADFSFYPHDGIGSFFLSLVTSPDRQQQALDIALKELEKVKTELNASEVERAKNKIASSIVLSGEVPLGRLRSIAGMWIYNGEYRSLEQDMETLNAITPQSLRKLMEDFPFDPMTVVSLGPG
jgi:predicted Zn-dependent peptidase